MRANKWWVALGLLGCFGLAAAQDSFPSKPIRLVVPVAAGGGIDAAFRAIGPVWGKLLGQQVVIDNKPGASQIIGTDLVARSAPDGLTLVAVGVPIAFNVALGRKMPYDVLKDLTPVAEVVTQPMLIAVHPSVPANNLPEFFKWAKAQPNPTPYGTGGPGSYGHLWWEMVRNQNNLVFEHVAYPGVAPALRDAVGGQIPVLVDAVVPTGVQVRAGKLKGLGIVRGTRSPLLPGVPTFAEQGVVIDDAAPFYGVLGPAGIPKPVLARLNQTLVQALQSAELRNTLQEMGFDIVAGTPETYGAKIRSEIDLWSRIVATHKIKLE